MPTAPSTYSLFDPSEVSGTRFADTAKGSAAIENPLLISLFSGAGGLDIGLERAGFQTLGCVETDSNCRATLRRNRPSWRLFEGAGQTPGDIRFMRGEDMLAEVGLQRGQLGVVAGGPPCQSYSNLGRRLGKSDPVNGDLYAEYIRVVRELAPRAIVFENVEGFNHPKHSEPRDFLLDELVNMGYRLAQGILNSADFGDPQVRRRFVVIGVLGDTVPYLPAPSYFESRSKWARSRFADSRSFQPYRTVQDALEELDSWNLERPDNLRMGVSDKVLQRMQLVGHGQNFKVLPDDMRPDCWRTGRHQGADTFGRLWPDRPSVTIRTSAYNPAKGRYIHPYENRGLSTMEMAVLQSFPQDWRFECAGSPTLVGIGRMIGNAVPVRLAEAVGFALAHSLAADDQRMASRTREASPMAATA